MPRSIAAAAELSEIAVFGAPMEPPAELTAEQAGYWRELVGANAASRFGPDHVPVLVALVTHMSIAKKLASEVATLSRRALSGNSKAAAEHRRAYLQLVDAANAETRVIMALSRSLRLCEQTKVRKDHHEAERRERPAGPRPWDTAERHN
jgi:hypothetical protein